MSLGRLPADVLLTFSRVLTGSVISWGLALLAGILFHAHKKSYRICLPVINFLRQISPYVWLPFAIMLLGLGEYSLIAVLFMAMFFPGVLMVFETIDHFPLSLKEEAITSGASDWQVLTKVQIPLLWRQLINIFRLLWSIGWSTVIAAEMLGVSGGLGFRLLDFRYLLEYRMMFLYIAVIGIIGIVSDRAILLLSGGKACFRPISRPESTAIGN